jgi:hypothetical protein
MVNQFLWIEWPEGDSHECKPCEMNALFANSRNLSTGPTVLDPPSTSKSTPVVSRSNFFFFHVVQSFNILISNIFF